MSKCGCGGKVSRFTLHSHNPIAWAGQLGSQTSGHYSTGDIPNINGAPKLYVKARCLICYHKKHGRIAPSNAVRTRRGVPTVGVRMSEGGPSAPLSGAMHLRAGSFPEELI